ncbi:MAG: SusC/RagA family TonB-linked outer membrane protein [Robiginitalea sp.]
MKSKITSVLSILCMVLGFNLALAQEKTVTGNVVDQYDVPLPGVSIVVAGTTRGTQTDFDGNYSILVNTGEVLSFSYIGQATTERTVGPADVINVQMIEDAQVLEEIVLQGYRSTTRSKSSVASQTLSAETIKNRPNANVLQTLSGQVAGLEVNTVSGQPGAAPTVRIRGINSINGNTAPLFIIDGAPVDEDNFRSINPQEIATIDVLKDAAATAIYGNRGANGVVVIKTRQGSFNTPLQINYTGILSYSSLQDNDYNLMSSPEQLALENERGSGLGAGLTAAEIAATPTFNWDEYFFRTGLTQNHNLSLQGGSERFSQFTSLGFFDQEGILKASDLKRFNIRNNLTGKSANDRFNYGTNISINYSESNEPDRIGEEGINNNFVIGAYNSVPYVTPEDYTNGADLLSPLLFYNTPLFLIDKLQTFTSKKEEVKIIGSINASYTITPELTAAITLGGDYQSEFLTLARGPESFNALLFGGAENPTSGFQQQASTRQFSYNQVTSLTYANSWGKHSVNIAGYLEYFKAHFRQFGYLANGLNPKTFYPGDGSGLIPVQYNEDEGALLFTDTANAEILNAGLFSYFGQADYDYDTRYGFTGTIRRDASYRFAGSNKWATFFSVAGRWNIHNESFMDGSVFNTLKLRASYGTAGNQRIAGTSYFSAPDLTKNFFATGPGYANQNSIFLSQVGNTTLQWETVAQLDIGVDFEVFDRKLRGSVDFYSKKTSDLFQRAPVSAINAITFLDANVGDLTNQGVDLSLGWDVIRSDEPDGFNLRLNGIANFNETKVKNIPTESGESLNDDGYTGRRNNGILNEYYLLRYAGVNPSNGNLLFLTAEGELSENPDADTDRVWLGKNLIPDWQGSFGFNMDFKGFFLTTQFNYVVGVDRFDFDLAAFQDPDVIGQFRTSRDLLRAWTPENPRTDIPSYDAFNRSAFTSDRYLREADYLRLRFAQIGYDFPARFLEKTGISRLRVFGNAENLFTWSKWKGFDAEAQANTLVGAPIYPTPRIFSFGFELGF